MPLSRRETAGTIVYRTSIVANPAYREQPRGVFSAALLGEIRLANVSARRTVYFDGTRSRSEELNMDYGVRSLALEFRNAGGDSNLYCKALRRFRFCVARPIELPVTGPPPHFTPLDETAVIAGLLCRKAVYVGPLALHVWFSEAIEVADPTGAVLRLEGVPGLILQTEEISASDQIDALLRVSVEALSFTPPPAAVFAPPPDYTTVGSLDAARAEDRQLLEVSANGLAPEMLIGMWRVEKPHDTIQMEILPGLRVRTTIPTAPVSAAGRIREEQAAVKGDLLVVDDPPNGRCYELSADGQTLAQVDNPVFSFTRCGRAAGA